MKLARSLVDDESMIAQHILPALGRMKVADVRHVHIDKLHRKITATGARVRANRVIALLSRMFGLAVIWEMRSDNPVKGIERNPETARHRYLEGDELERLLAAVATHPNRQGAHVIELLLLTGARRSEVFTIRWEQLDLGDGIWTKPASATKQARLHRIPLSAPARRVLVEIKQALHRLGGDKRDLGCIAAKHVANPGLRHDVIGFLINVVKDEARAAIRTEPIPFMMRRPQVHLAATHAVDPNYRTRCGPASPATGSSSRPPALRTSCCRSSRLWTSFANGLSGRWRQCDGNGPVPRR